MIVWPPSYQQALWCMLEVIYRLNKQMMTWTRLGSNVPRTKHIYDVGESSIAMTLPVKLQFSQPVTSFESRRPICGKES